MLKIVKPYRMICPRTKFLKRTSKPGALSLFAPNNLIHFLIHMAKRPFINNNTFSGCLHSKGVVQHFHLDLQDNMHLFQPSR